MPVTENDIKSVANASQLINANLLNKGFPEKLLFNSIDWESLLEGQKGGSTRKRKKQNPVSVGEDNPFLEEKVDSPELAEDSQDDTFDLQITRRIYNNDKNVINVIHSLLQQIDETKHQKEAFLKALNEHEQEKKEMKNRIDQLNRKIDQQTTDLGEVTCHTKSQQTTIKRLETLHSATLKEVKQLKNFSTALKAKYDNEVRRKDVELTTMQDKLLDRRLTASRNANIASSPLTGSVIYGNNPSLINFNYEQQVQRLHSADGSLDDGRSTFVNEEFKKMMVDLANLITNLLSENSQFLRFNKSLSRYFQDVDLLVTNNRIIDKLPDIATYLQADEALEAGRRQKDPTKTLDEMIEEMEEFKTASDSITIRLQTIFNEKLGNFDKNDKVLMNEEIESLKTELESVTKNWKAAMSTMERWRSYKGTE
ncbi:hypothetical protein BABINDRAFT_161801 [Babjeviella inositovora NRRL Y-12698]|uniref:Autophagy-related protein 25 n=1 Tax=Babjeviella inositovora NRRL Y-12698 TaxID=984486 RepID=A0A1E3QNV8_9ASCO|nr:uncharacterized protein BABINDRAFT_161801 [Babjeviella inositovora NRRL Y-12698]ODQ79396.1 hypothetical protein BABINDRAFT_161801 [Babjeviella inositovora NRRL Y-12698]